MSFVEPADVPPKRRVPPRHPKGSYSIDPITRRRLYGTSDSSGSKPENPPLSFFGTDSIYNVTSSNFDEVMQSMEKAFVMFYDPLSASSACAGVEFVKAAEMPHPSNHAFAAVDCTQEQELCAREEATRLPIFKLYSNGLYLTTIRNAKICADKMQMMMKTTQVLTPPRRNVAPLLQRR